MPTVTYPGFTIDAAPENYEAALRAALAQQAGDAEETTLPGSDGPESIIAPDSGTAAADAVSALIAAQEQLAAIQEGDVETAQKAGAIAAQVTREKGLLELQKQQKLSRIAVSAGLSLDDPSQIQTGFEEQMRMHLQQAMEKAKVYREVKEREAGFWKDPISSLKASFEIDAARADYNTEAELYNIAEAGLQSLNSAVQQAAKTQEDIAPKTTASIVMQQADAQVVAASAAANKARIDALTSGVAAKQTAVNGIQWQATLEDRQLARAEAGAKKQEKADLETEIYETMKVGHQTLRPGKPIPFTRDQAVALYNKKDPNAQLFTSVGSNTIANQRPTYSRTPGETALLMKEVGTRLTPEMAVLADALEDSRNEAMTLPGADIAKPEVIAATTTQRFTVKAKAMGASIKYEDGTNIYQAPNTASVTVLAASSQDPKVVEANTALRSTAFYQKVLAPQVAAGMTETDPTKIVNLAKTAVKKGDVSLQDAVKGISSYFKTAVLLNNVTKNYVGVGAEPQTTYNANVRGKFFGSDNVNLADETRTAAFLAKGLFEDFNVGGVYLGELPQQPQGAK